jgi:hypothetical protein
VLPAPEEPVGSPDGENRGLKFGSREERLRAGNCLASPWCRCYLIYVSGYRSMWFMAKAGKQHTSRS